MAIRSLALALLLLVLLALTAAEDKETETVTVDKEPGKVAAEGLTAAKSKIDCEVMGNCPATPAGPRQEANKYSRGCSHQLGCRGRK